MADIIGVSAIDSCQIQSAEEWEASVYALRTAPAVSQRGPLLSTEIHVGC